MKLVSTNVIRPLMLFGVGPGTVVKLNIVDHWLVLTPFELDAFARQKYCVPVLR